MSTPPDPIQNLLAAGSARGSFPESSRYHKLDTALWRTPDGRLVPYVRRRLVPPPENFETLTEHTVTQGDRIDNLAGRYLGDPEQFWRLCDANGAIRPAELTEKTGQRVRIPLPEGVPGPTSHA